jgi:hypothetical protein
MMMTMIRLMMHAIRLCGTRGLARMALLWLAATATAAHGHGLPLVLHYDAGTNRLSVLPNTEPPGGGFVNADGLTIYSYLSEEEAFFGFGNGPYWTEFPGFRRAASLPANTTVGIRFLTPLLYWNPATQPSDPLPSSNAEIEIVDYNAAIALVDPSGASGTNPLALAEFVGQTGGDHKHFTGYYLSPQVDPLVAADTFGLYGLWATAAATGGGFAGGAAQESDPFLIVLNYGITDGGTYTTGVNRLAVTAVPEPSTLGLLGTAIAVAGWRWRCRGGFSAGRARAGA